MAFTFAKIDGVLINLSNVGSIRKTKYDDKPCLLFSAANGDVLHRFYLPNEAAQRAYNKLVEYALYDFDEKVATSTVRPIASTSESIEEYTVHEFEYATDGVFPSHEIRNSQGDVVIYGDKHRAPVYASVLNTETARLRSDLSKADQQSRTIAATAIELREQLKETKRELEIARAARQILDGVIRDAHKRLTDGRIHDYDKAELAKEILEPYTEPKEQS